MLETTCNTSMASHSAWQVLSRPAPRVPRCDCTLGCCEKQWENPTQRYKRPTRCLGCVTPWCVYTCIYIYNYINMYTYNYMCIYIILVVWMCHPNRNMGVWNPVTYITYIHSWLDEASLHRSYDSYGCGTKILPASCCGCTTQIHHKSEGDFKPSVSDTGFNLVSIKVRPSICPFKKSCHQSSSLWPLCIHPTTPNWNRQHHTHAAEGPKPLRTGLSEPLRSGFQV